MEQIITNEHNILFGKTAVAKKHLSKGTLSCAIAGKADGGSTIHFYNGKGDHVDQISVDAVDPEEIFHHFLYGFDAAVTISIDGETEKAREKNVAGFASGELLKFSISYTAH